MTISEAIQQIDSLKHNTCTLVEKLDWLSQLDGMVKVLILDTHEGETRDFAFYTPQTPGDTQLLIPEEFSSAYRYWLEAQIDYVNGEYVRFNNASAMFGAVLQQFADHYHRTHSPKNYRNQFR